MKTAIRFASYFLIFAVGLVVGFYSGSRFSETRASAFDAIETANYLAYMGIQMSEGTDAAREEAIHGYLALIEKHKEHSNDLFTEKVYAIDAALANARLAALAQKRGAAQEAQQYLNRAVSFCPQIGWRECSPRKLTIWFNGWIKTVPLKQGAQNE